MFMVLVFMFLILIVKLLLCSSRHTTQILVSFPRAAERCIAHMNMNGVCPHSCALADGSDDDDDDDDDDDEHTLRETETERAHTMYTAHLSLGEQCSRSW